MPSASSVEKKWYVVNTYSGHENKVKEKQQTGIKSFAVNMKKGNFIVSSEFTNRQRK